MTAITFIKAFLVGGGICLAGQIIINFRTYLQLFGLIKIKKY